MATTPLTKIRDAFSQSHERKQLSIKEYHRAGVLVPIVTANSECSLLLTKRTETVETHKGQVSFPGGMVNDGDEDITATALRELHEETGIAPQTVQILGLLDDLPVPTGFVVTPVVGIVQSIDSLAINKAEVAEAFEVPLYYFQDQANGRMEYRESRGSMHEVWFYEFEGRNIWGATAMIVRSLLRRTGLLDIERD
ncbi:MAG TPA: CoA pyrophosphatase [Bacteroidota bacterium]